MQTTEQWLDEKIFAYNEDPKETLEIMLQIFTDEVPKEGRSRVGKTYIDYVYLNKQIHASELNDISEVYDIQNAYIYQDLIHKGYAVPIYFGPDHWANGKTAIELGIAIDGKNYK